MIENIKQEKAGIEYTHATIMRNLIYMHPYIHISIKYAIERVDGFTPSQWQ